MLDNFKKMKNREYQKEIAEKNRHINTLIAEQEQHRIGQDLHDTFRACVCKFIIKIRISL